jgi:hypothetical protein
MDMANNFAVLAVEKRVDNAMASDIINISLTKREIKRNQFFPRDIYSFV